jgi:hypothetical protein
MSKSKEQSAIDVIYTMLEKVELLDKRVQIIDDNLKILSNKVSKLNKNAAVAAVISPIVKDNIQSQPIRQQKVQKLVLGNIKLHGYIVNKAKTPIPGVVVNVYNDSNEKVKNLNSDANGHWEVRLPAGRFGVEYVHKKFKPINRTVELEEDQNEYEVR